MAKDTSSVKLFTNLFQLSYPKLIKPEPYMEKGKPKGEPVYSFEALSTKESLNDWVEILDDGEETVNVEKRMSQLAKEQWGDDFSVKDAVKYGGLSWPFKSGDAKAEEKNGKAEHYRGKKFWRAKALSVINGNRNVPNFYRVIKGSLERINPDIPAGEELVSKLFYPGAFCKAEVNAVAGITGENKYITFYLNAIVFEKDGERISGSGSSIERMYGVRGGASNYNPTEGMDTDLDDGDIPG